MLNLIESIQTKECKHCRKNLSLAEFTISRSEKDGLSRYCRLCNKFRPFPKPDKKICEICRKEKPLAAFLNVDTGRDSKFCHDCLPKYELNRYYIASRNDPEGFKEYHREYKREWRSRNKKLNIQIFNTNSCSTS